MEKTTLQETFAELSEADSSSGDDIATMADQNSMHVERARESSDLPQARVTDVSSDKKKKRALGQA